MKTNMIFACAVLCTSLGTLSMESEKKEPFSPAVNRKKQADPNKPINSPASLSNSYIGYRWYTSRNILVPEEVIRKLSKQDEEEARKHNRLVRCNIDGCFYIHSQPIKLVSKDEKTKPVITDVALTQLLKILRNNEVCVPASQNKDLFSGKLSGYGVRLDEYAPLKESNSSAGKRCSCVLL